MATATKTTTKARSATAQRSEAVVASDIYEVEESEADLPENQFRFRGPDKELYSVPKLAFLRPSLVDKVDADNMVPSMLLLLNAYHPGLGDRFKDGQQLGNLFLAWAVASGIDLGESVASTGS